MPKQEIYEIIKKRFGTSDEDLADLGVIMDALDGIDRAETLEQQIANMTLEHDRELKDLDNKWRDRYRERFFTGDSDITDVIDKLENDPETIEDQTDITIDEYLERLDEKGVYHNAD